MGLSPSVGLLLGSFAGVSTLLFLVDFADIFYFSLRLLSLGLEVDRLHSAGGSR
jgi:hypothetical protein